MGIYSRIYGKRAITVNSVYVARFINASWNYVVMATGSDEEGMKRSTRGRKPQYTWFAVFCLGELYIEAIRGLNNEREIMGFTQAAIHDCVKRFENVKNPDIIKNAIYDAESRGLVARRKVRKRGRDLFIPTKSGLILYAILNEISRNLILAVPILADPPKAKEEITRFQLILDSLIIHLSLYEILAKDRNDLLEYQRISKRLSLLKEIKRAVNGYGKEAPTSIEATRLYNTIKYLFRVLERMKIVGTAALCNVINDIIDRADPLTWDENVLG